MSALHNKRIEVFSVLIALIASIMISGCGQKGPLRLPPPPPEQNQPDSTNTTAKTLANKGAVIKPNLPSSTIESSDNN